MRRPHPRPGGLPCPSPQSGRFGRGLPHGKAPALVEHGKAPVEALVDLYLQAGIACPLAVCQDLEPAPLVGHDVVGTGRPSVLEAEDALGIEPLGQHSVSRALLGRGHGEVAVVASQEGRQEAVGRLDVDIPFRRISEVRRSWKVPQSLSILPLACGLLAGIEAMASSSRSRPNWVGSRLPKSCSDRVGGSLDEVWKMLCRSWYTATGRPFLAMIPSKRRK